MKKLIPFFLFVVCLSCSNHKVVEIKNHQGTVIQRITLFGDTMSGKNGIYVRYDEKGLILDSSVYTNGKLEGEKRIYQDGKLYCIEQHKNDLYEGPYVSYYPNGQIQVEAQYVNNEMNGVLKAYYPSGKLKEIVEMKSNQENGPFVEYYENGNKKAEGEYLNGPNENGLLVLYDSTGKMERKMSCKEGICNTIWKADSTSVNDPDK